MANTFTLTAAARNAACDAIVNLLDVGAGTQGDCIIKGASDTTLVTIDLGTTVFGNAGSAVAGQAEMNAATSTGTAVAAGTATSFALRDQDDTAVCGGDVGVGTGIMQITNTSIAVSDVVQITAMTVTVPAS